MFKAITRLITVAGVIVVTFVALVACTPLVTIEIQNTQRTNSEATRSPVEIDSPQLGSERTQHKPVTTELKVNGEIQDENRNNKK